MLTIAPTPSITVSPNTLAFQQASGSGSQKTIAVFSSFGMSKFSASASTSGGGNWLGVTPRNGDAPGSLDVSVNAAGLPVGSYNGTVTVSPVGGAGGPQVIQVMLAVTASPALTASTTSLSFSAEIGGAPPAAQTINLGSTGAAVPFIASLSTTSGGQWLRVASVTGTAPGGLNISTDPKGLAPGFYSGIVTITPTNSASVPLNVPVSLTITQAGGAIAAVTNGASFSAGPIAPGEVVTIFGSNLGPSNLATLHVAADGSVDTQIEETRVFFDDIPAPLIYVSGGQISVIVPYELEGRAGTRIQVEYKGARSNSVALRVIDSAPGIFTTNSAGQGAILNQDASVNSAGNGAEPGSVISIYATGEGATTPGGITGLITTDVLAKPKLPVTVQIGEDDAEVLYAGSAPGLPAGIFQINVRIPSTARSGSIPVIVKVGDRTSQSGVTVSVKP
jgi:uncharacterized protein (TIGR03437 family)